MRLDLSSPRNSKNNTTNINQKKASHSSRRILQTAVTSPRISQTTANFGEAINLNPTTDLDEPLLL